MTLVEFAVTCYNWLFLVERKKMVLPEDMEDTATKFTHVLQGICADYIEEKAQGTKPNLVRMEDNRLLWQFGSASMSITVNDVSAEYS